MASAKSVLTNSLEYSALFRSTLVIDQYPTLVIEKFQYGKVGVSRRPH